ncbi:MAG: twin-arginine translocase subunit TatC [Alphaproteobacteria bacterium]|nr:twin-arginine translocase subunit TatC [Alphaproteobacteria bacterium]
MNSQNETFISHLTELRYRLMISLSALLIGFFMCFYIADYIFNFLTTPLVDVFGDISNRRLIYTGLAEKFFTNVKLAFFASFMIMFPILLSQVWAFIAPGLYKNEKRVFFPFLIMTPVLFFIGSAFVYYFVLPIAWDFFVGFEQIGNNTTLAIQLESKVDEYLSLVMQLIFAFGLAFELPILLLLLVQVGATDAEGLKKKRKYAILISFVVSAILTPPDPLSQIGLAIPMILLYEVSILIAILMKKKKKKER